MIVLSFTASLNLPRYVRVNTLKTTLEEVKKELTILGYELKKTRQVSTNNGLMLLENFVME